MAAPAFLIGSVLSDPVIIGAIIAAVGGVILRLAPKTRSEAGVDLAKAHVDNASAWTQLVEQHKAMNAQLSAEMVTLRERVTAAEDAAKHAEERASEAERRAEAAELRISELEAAGSSSERVWFFSGDEDDEP